MALKVDAYAQREAPLPTSAPTTGTTLPAGWRPGASEITHSGGLRHAFARLDVNDVICLEQECSIWRSRMLPPPVVALAPSRSLTSHQPKAKAPPAGFELEGADRAGQPVALADALTPGSPTSTAATEVIVVNPIQVPPQSGYPTSPPKDTHLPQHANCPLLTGWGQPPTSSNQGTVVANVRCCTPGPWVVQRGDITKQDAQQVTDLVDKAEVDGQAIIIWTAAPPCQDFSMIVDGPGHKETRPHQRHTPNYQACAYGNHTGNGRKCTPGTQVFPPDAHARWLTDSRQFAPWHYNREPMMHDDTGRLVIPPPNIDQGATPRAARGLHRRGRPG